MKAPVLDDCELAREDLPFHGDTVIGTIERTTWLRVTAAGLIPDILTAAEQGGWEAVLNILKLRRLIATAIPG